MKSAQLDLASSEFGTRGSSLPNVARTTPHASGTRDGIRPTVLIVDDNAMNLLAFQEMLRRDDIEIVTAASGNEALEILLVRDVAVAIIDVQMPEMNGLALAELLRGVERTRNVPIIFVTAGHDPSWVFKGYEAGAVDFLFKPVDDVVLRGKVDTFVKLERQRQELLQIERMREIFVGILGHDLRNPLQGIFVWAQLALRVSGDESAYDALQMILKNSRRMERMIEQLLDTTRIRLGGGLPLRAVSADLKELTELAVDDLAEHRSRIRFDVSGDMQGVWDVDRLSQVVSNLVGNAVEHSDPETAIRIRLDGTEQEAVVLEVHNQGPAIPDELRDVLFEPFRGRQRERGLGLGLFISKEFVAAHGGTLEFDSSEQSGTYFTARLPRDAAAAAGARGTDE